MSDSDSLLTNHTKDESEKALSKGKLSWNDGTRSDSMNSSAEIPDSGDEEESVVRPRNMKKYIDLSESESEADSIREPSNVSDELSDEECFESRALSPRTRMSITGFRPRDLSEGESDVYDDIYEESVNTLEKSSLKKENVGDMCNEKNSSLQGIIAVTPILSNVQFPSARMSTEFNYSIGGKLSSTVMNKGSPENAISLSSESDSSVNIHSSTPARPLKLIQPRIIEIFDSPRKKETNFKNTVEYVSKEFMDNEVKKLNELQSDLATCEKLCETLSSKLPDKGKRMSGRGERLREAIAALSLSISNLRVKNEENPKKENNNLPGPTWEELTDAANSIQPKYTGKVGMANFMTQKTLTIDRLKDIHGSLESCPGENVLADEPKYLNVPLMQHQRHALAWMYWREKQRPRGGILADDMGLGKTLSMISLILASKQKKTVQTESSDSDESDNNSNAGAWTVKGRRDYYDGGTIVICPASLIRQWESEVQKRIKSHKLTVCVHHGNTRETKARSMAKYDIVITTYNLIAREMRSEGCLFGITWKRIILDEAHIIRNYKSQASEAACKLNGKTRWALTGTPIQNKEMDLYAILKFLKCTPFDELAHWKKWIANKSAGGQQRLHTLMKSLMLRRTKLQLEEYGALKLPRKTLEIVEVPLDNEEMNVYQKIMLFSRSLFAQFLIQRAEKSSYFMFNSEGSKPASLQTKDQNGTYYKIHQKFTRLDRQTEVKSYEILVLLLRLRQICCHPGLIDSMLYDEDNNSSVEESHSGEISQDIDLLDQLNKLQINDESTDALQPTDSLINPNEKAISKTLSKVLLRTNPVFDLSRPSSKMKKVIEILENKILNSGDKAIVVSQWTSVLNILKDYLAAKRIAVVSLNGSVAVKLRNDIVNNFNDSHNNTKVMLLSLTAGGVGLNLVGANHLLLLDLHWNPQLEAQAQDRIYRVGQNKCVHIYKFMCKETVEESIKALQDKKMAIANGVLTGMKTNEGSKLSIEDLKSLFGL